MHEERSRPAARSARSVVMPPLFPLSCPAFFPSSCPAKAGHPVTRAAIEAEAVPCRRAGNLLDRPLSRTMTTEKRLLRAGDGSGPVKRLRKTVAGRPVHSTTGAAGLTLRHLLTAGVYRRSKRTRSGIGKPAPFREEAPCRRKANPRQATGAAASALGARSCGFLAFHAEKSLTNYEVYLDGTHSENSRPPASSVSALRRPERMAFLKAAKSSSRIVGNHRYSWMKNKRSPSVSRTRPRTFRRNMMS